MNTPVSLLSLEVEETISSLVLAASDAIATEPDAIDVALFSKPQIALKTLDSIQHEPINTINTDPLQTLQALAADASTCRLCGLAETRKHVVFGRGNAQANILFVGEAPNSDEDAQGQPFVGASGKLLDRMLHALGLQHDQVYIMNSIKCRPANSRDPRPDEIQACKLWFDQQLDILQPKMICLLGRVAAQTVLDSDAPLADLRGQWHEYHGIPAWVTYHPAYLLRSPKQKQKSWQDLLQLSQRYQSM